MKHAASLSLAGILVVVVGCGSGGAPDKIASVGQPIVKGSASDASQESVVRIDQAGDFACTGTLVAPNLLLTARHCVAEIGGRTMCGEFDAPSPATELTILVGIDAKPTGIKGKEIFVEDSNDACINDIALVVLDGDVPNAKISKVRTTALTVGEDALTVGYGDDGTGSSFDKLPPREQRTGLHVDAIGPTTWKYKTKGGQELPVELSEDEIATGESTCVGDSGGPLFDKEGQVIGVTSRGIDDSCLDRPSIYAATAKHEPLIKKAFEAAGRNLDGTSVAPAAPAPSTATTPEAPSTSPVVASAPASGDAGGCSTGGAPARESSLALVAFGLCALAGARRSKRTRSGK